VNGRKERKRGVGEGEMKGKLLKTGQLLMPLKLFSSSHSFIFSIYE